MNFYRFLIFLFIIHKTLGKDINLESDDDVEIEFDETNEILITVEDGFQILITVESLNMTNDQNTAEYILINADGKTDDDYDGIIFTHFIKTPRQYLSLNNKVSISKREIDVMKPQRTKSLEDETNSEAFDVIETAETETPEPEIPKSEFKITVRRFGEGTTTTETPTTEIPWPTPSIHESDEITVNITGQPPSWYTNDNIRLLRENIAKMAIEYCEINNIQGNISYENVLIDTIVQCPINWPNRQNCVQITFRLPIIQEDDEEYQLTTEHLQLMWSRHSENFLQPLFTNYELPSASIFTTWLIIICVIILLFSVVLYLFKRFKQKLTGFSKRKKSVSSDQENIIYSEAPRSDSLHPHPKQIVPGMFESENQYYDPDAADLR